MRFARLNMIILLAPLAVAACSAGVDAGSEYESFRVESRRDQAEGVPWMAGPGQRLYVEVVEKASRPCVARDAYDRCVRKAAGKVHVPPARSVALPVATNAPVRQADGLLHAREIIVPEGAPSAADGSLVRR